MSSIGEPYLKQGDKLWFDFPMSSEEVEKVRNIYNEASWPDMDESPPLVYASFLGLKNIVKAFIECAKQTNTNLHSGETGEGELQKFLWLSGRNGRTALDMAIEKNHVDIAKLLLENASLECLISERNYQGLLPVSLLSDPQHDEFIFKILEDAKRRDDVYPPTSTSTSTSTSVSIDEHQPQVTFAGSGEYTEMTMNLYVPSQSNHFGTSWYEFQIQSSQPELNITILHLVAEYGDVKYLKDSLTSHSDLLCCNSEGETPAYIAAREGHVDILAIMIHHLKNRNDIVELVTRTDKNTALHIAIQNHHVGVVFWLLKEIPKLIECVNDYGEIPHYLAAERGFHYIFDQIFNQSNKSDFTRLDGKTSLHAAAISGSTECIRTIVNHSKDLLYQEDKRGWTPLNYAIYHNYSSATSALLDADRSIGYRMLKKDDTTISPIYFAASQGHCEIMKILISKSPVCIQFTYGKGRNILHFAIENKKTEVIEFIFSCDLFTSLINKKDGDGNTPIHLFMQSDLKMMEVLMDSRVNIHALNNKKHTPLDVASSDEKRERLLKGIANVRSRGNQARVLFPKVISLSRHVDVEEMAQRRKEMAQRRKEMRKEIREERELRMKENEKQIEPFFKVVENLVLVATLIATASFAAGFTVPGGFDGNEGSNQGMPILLRKAAYKAFVVTNTLAFSCSSSVLLGYIWMLLYRLRLDEFSEDELEDKIAQRMFIMYILTGFALITMAIAFVTGIYVVLTPSLTLAIVLCVMSVLIMVFTTVFPTKTANFLTKLFD